MTHAEGADGTRSSPPFPRPPSQCSARGCGSMSCMVGGTQLRPASVASLYGLSVVLYISSLCSLSS
eukprot:scaffold8058_cov134-Isochrysis_galbana.AAC.4